MLLIVSILILIPIIDQVFKLLALQCLSGAPVGIIGSAVNLTLVKNSGAAFGIGADRRVVLLVLTVFALICAVWLLLFSEIKFSSKIALAFVVGGGLGNLFDRIFRGFVVDYIDLSFLHFAVFNFADICVSLGSAVLIFLILKPQKRKI